MKLTFLLSSLCLLLCFSCTQNPTNDQEGKAVATSNSNKTEQAAAEYTIVIHGGAGSMSKKNTTPAREKAARAALNAALDKGESILKNGGSAMDAVEQTIMLMENNPLGGCFIQPEHFAQVP